MLRSRAHPAVRPATILAVSLATAALASLPRTVLGQQQPSADADARARDEFLTGRDQFARGNYGEAAQHFQRAYDLSHRPQLLYNLGTSFDRLHEWQHALTAFDQFQRELPNAPEHAEVDSRLRVIREEIASEQRQAEELRTERERATRAAAAAANRPVIVVRDPPRPWLDTGYITGGLGIVSLLAGGSVAVFSYIGYNSARNDCGVVGNCPTSITDVLYQQSVVSEVLLINGAALVVIASGSLFLDSRRHRPSEHPSDTHTPVARWTPSLSVTPGGAALQIMGTF